MHLQFNSPENPDGRPRVRLPLSISRMSQSIEILFRVPIAVAKKRSYVPELVDIPVTQNWLSISRPDGTTPQGWQTRSTQTSIVESARQRRAIALARSAVESVEYAVDTVAERPSEEVMAWLSPWASRYTRIARSAGHPSSEPSKKDSLPEFESQWNSLDQRMAQYVDRYPPEPKVKNELAPLTFDMPDLDGFQTTEIIELSSTNSPPSLQSNSTRDRGLRKMMVNLLTLALVTGMLVSLRPIRRFALPVAVHPAFWLGLMGLFGLAVAPVSVAVSLMIVAIMLPVFPKTRYKS